jgi:hypothetical protein
MNYWLDLFTGTTWKEFRGAGAKITGFRHHMRGSHRDVKPDDIFLCYLTGVMRWVGALQVIGPSDDKTPIWTDGDFPVRFAVKPLVVLDPEYGVPMDALEGKVDFYSSPRLRGKFNGFVRRSPNRFQKAEDGKLVLDLIRKAEKEPQFKQVDPRRLNRKPLYKAHRKAGKSTVTTVVSVPDSDGEGDGGDTATYQDVDPVPATTRHTEVQYQLVKLGAEMGLDVWVARNDRNKTFSGETLGEMRGMIAELPTQFNEATNRTIELIDVLWLRANSIVAAFEVECTTSIYSGLLRMSDLMALQPNLNIKLYLVAPDERRGKVEQEILRPTFSLRERPLPEICGFLSFSTLMDKVEGIYRLGLATSLKPDFLEQTAEFFTADSAEE